MALSKILVPLYDRVDSVIALDLAAEIATHFHAHIEVVETNLATAKPGQESTTNSDLPDSDLSSVFESWRQRHRLELQPECLFRGLASTSLINHANPLESTLRDRARFSDVVCATARPGDAEMREAKDLWTLLFDSGRPVVLRPTREDMKSAPLMGEPLLIGWNGRAEAVRAVAGAMPFIRASRRVEVMSIGEKAVNAFDAYEVAKYLAWSGVRATASGIAIEDWTGEDVIDAALGRGAQLLVMGARKRGSVTSHMLRTLPITAFIAA